MSVCEQDVDRERAELLNGTPRELWFAAVRVDDLIDTTSASGRTRNVQLGTHVAILHSPERHHELEVEAPMAIQGHVHPQLPDVRRPILRGREIRVPLDAHHAGHTTAQERKTSWFAWLETHQSSGGPYTGMGRATASLARASGPWGANRNGIATENAYVTFALAAAAHLRRTCG